MLKKEKRLSNIKTHAVKKYYGNANLGIHMDHINSDRQWIGDIQQTWYHELWIVVFSYFIAIKTEIEPTTFIAGWVPGSWLVE